MNEIETYLFNLIKSPPDTISQNLFDKFVSEAHNIEAVNLILKTEKMLKEKWIIQNRISDILQQQVFVPNGTVSKDYLTKIDFSKQGWEDIVYTEFEGLETIGLSIIMNSKQYRDVQINQVILRYYSNLGSRRT
jgi:hypothetical protein